MMALVFRCPTALLFTEFVFCSLRSVSWVQVPWHIGVDPAEAFEDLSCIVSSGFSFCFQWGDQFCLWMSFKPVSVRKAFLPCFCLDIWPSDSNKVNCCASGQRSGSLIMGSHCVPTAAVVWEELLLNAVFRLYYFVHELPLWKDFWIAQKLTLQASENLQGRLL